MGRSIQIENTIRKTCIMRMCNATMRAARKAPNLLLPSSAILTASSPAACLGVRTPVATLHQRGKDIGTRYQARGAGSAKGISVFLLGRDPSYLFPPDSSLCCSLLSALLRNPTRRTILADSVYRTQKRSPLRRARIRTGVRCCSAHRDWHCPGMAERPGVEGRLHLSP